MVNVFFFIKLYFNVLFNTANDWPSATVCSYPLSMLFSYPMALCSMKACVFENEKAPEKTEETYQRDRANCLKY